MDKKKVVILGAGISGLAVGYYLAKSDQFDVTILEKESVNGGVCASFKLNEFTLDYGAHKIYSTIPGVMDEIWNIMEGRLLKIIKKNSLFLQKRLADYPLRMGNLAKVLGPIAFLKIGMGYGWQILTNIIKPSPDDSYETYMVKRFGWPAYHLVFEPLAKKVWGDPKTLHPEMARTRVPSSGGIQVLLEMVGLKKATAQTNAQYYYYPENGGFGEFSNTLERFIIKKGGKIINNVNITEIKKENGSIKEISGEINEDSYNISCDYVVSTIPLPRLSELIDQKGITPLANNLKFRHVIIIYLFIDRDLVLNDQWIFFPEEKYLFSRIFEQKQMSLDLGPKGKTVICCDFTCSEDSWQWKEKDENLAKQCVEDLIKSGFIKENEVQDSHVVRFRDFYPRYDLTYMETLQQVNDKLKETDNLILSGRLGMYNYNNSDHCLDMGRFIADGLTAGKSPINIWNDLEDRTKGYRIVD